MHSGCSPEAATAGGLGCSGVEEATKAWEGEAGKGTSFAAGENCLYSYSPELTPLGVRPSVEQTLGGDRDWHSGGLKNTQRHVALLQVSAVGSICPALIFPN